MATSILRRHLLSVLIVLAVGFSLLNGNIFGGTTLISFFFYTLTTAFVAVLLAGRVLFKKHAQAWHPPTYIKLFCVLGLYVAIHGLVQHNFAIPHYYYLANVVTLVGINYWFGATQADGNKKQGSKVPVSATAFTFLKGIGILVLLESVVVLLQCVNVIPVPNPFFLCTGTWINPNVTAMFLAMGLFAVIKWYKWAGKGMPKYIVAGILGAALLSIVVLQCRSAYLAALVLLLAEQGAAIKNYLKSRMKFTLSGVALGILLAIVAIVIVGVFATKKTSAFNRLQIWGTSAELIAQKPLTGHGFGLFEKEYNLFAAAKQYEQNDHINMAYNDFLELGVEGGLVAVVLWLAFYLAAWRHFRNNNHFFTGRMMPVIWAFFIIQCTNFGFQAIPATVLFFMYMGGGDYLSGTVPTAKKTTTGFGQWRYWKPVYGVLGGVLAVGLFYQITVLMVAFYDKWTIEKSVANEKTLGQYQRLTPVLKGYASFHERMGDMLLQQRQVEKAKQQYRLALERTSEVDVLAKYGFCYQVQGMYDSSAYYYTLTQHIQPHKLQPHFQLMKLYEQKKDSAMMTAQAETILDMPIKVRNKRMLDIKRLAAFKLDSCRKTDRYTTMLAKQLRD